MQKSRVLALSGLCCSLAAGATASGQGYDWRLDLDGIPSSAVVAGDGLLLWASGERLMLVRQNPEQMSKPFFDESFRVGAGILSRPALLASEQQASDQSTASRPVAFVTSTAGYLYAVDLNSGATASRDLRRAACPSDRLSAPLVISKAATTVGATGRDLVLVGTRRECGDKSGNQVIALDPRDLAKSPVWVFNAGEYEVGYIASCISDAQRNSVYCSADASGSDTQMSVFSVDASSGKLNWSAALGSVHGSPALDRGTVTKSDRLYVGAVKGRLNTLNPDDGSLHWFLDVTADSYGEASRRIERDLMIADGAYKGTVLVVDGGGVLYAVFDDTLSGQGTEQWRTSFAVGQVVVTRAEPVSEIGKVYVGLKDGTVHQLDLASGLDEARLKTAGTGPWPGQMMDLLTYNFAGRWRLLGTFMGGMPGDLDNRHDARQFPIPCGFATIDCRPQPSDVLPSTPAPPPPIVPAPAPVAPPPSPQVPPQLSIPFCGRLGAAIIVRADQEWCNSGVKLNGDNGRLTIVAKGRWSNAGPPQLGPDGFPNYVYPGTLLASANLASLIGMVGDTRFAIGTRLDSRNDKQGMLLLSINDTPGTFADNKGYVEVVVSQRRE